MPVKSAGCGHADKRTVLFIGYSRLPGSIPAWNVYYNVTVVIEVDMESKVIVDTDVTLPTSLARRIVRSCLNGHNLGKDRLKMESSIRCRYRGDAQKAVLSAFKKAYERFLNYQKD
ncbi:MAG: DUF3870 domain-containing protein [Synergistota bacterium]|jgi:hypothetical protein|nr:DUF3870 domain-containing protein [Synergistota bacterium]